MSSSILNSYQSIRKDNKKAVPVSSHSLLDASSVDQRRSTGSGERFLLMTMPLHITTAAMIERLMANLIMIVTKRLQNNSKKTPSRSTLCGPDLVCNHLYCASLHHDSHLTCVAPNPLIVKTRLLFGCIDGTLWWRKHRNGRYHAPSAYNIHRRYAAVCWKKFN